MKKQEVVYVFIDSQNLNLGTSKTIRNSHGKVVYRGWKLDFGKLHRYLTDKYRAQKIFIFIGYIHSFQSLYRELQSFGYTLVFKQTVKDGHGRPKGNVDAELVLHSAAVEYNHYDKAVIVSGDGDFACLLEYLESNNKLAAIIIPNTKSASSLLLPYEKYKVLIEYEKPKLSK